MIEDAVLSKYLWVAASASFTFCFIAVLLECVCGCRKRIPKNELLGLAGMVKITNPDENVNFSSSTPNIQLNSVTISTDDHAGDTNDTNRRSSGTVATATRSLPDLPVDTGEGGEKCWGPGEANTDTNSELYATVEDPTRSKKRVLTRGLTAESSYTPSQTDDSLSPYARLKGEHPYDQLQQSEHQYAQVGANGNAIPSTSQDTTVNSTPSRRFDADRESQSKSPSLSEPLDDIPAASAIAGSVPANHDLPYMTPPLPTEHFSGDSQDSCKGYTSISVREPLARIMGTRRTDPHYATVSDDSDEMYAAIEERNTEYTSGSETYAQIAPVTANSQPPPVHQPQQHTRQESSSSACSSVVSPGSPKREKRQANSPLPEPPQSPTIDEMYAKVVKKQRSNHSGIGTPESEVFPELPGSPSPLLQQQESPTQVRYDSPTSKTPGYEKVRGLVDSEPNYEELMHPENEPARPTSSASRHSYEASSTVPCYESVRPPNDSKTPGYEKVRGPDDSEPNYEELVHHHEGGEPDYASLSRRHYESVDSKDSDPNYESVTNQEPPYEKLGVNPETSPDYETIYREEAQVTSCTTSVMELYAQVNKSPEKSLPNGMPKGDWEQNID